MDNQLDYTHFDLFRFASKSEKLYDFIQKHPDLINKIKVILNVPKSISIHPSAMAVLPKRDKNGVERELSTWTPTRIVDGMVVSEYEGKYIDKAGILKEDVLGILQLDKLQSCLKLIKQNTGKEIDLYSLEPDDKKTFELFSKGLNEDVFQLGSHGLKKYCKEVKPKDFESIVAITALYRPGPMGNGFHKDFVNLREGVKEVEYDFGMEPVVKETFGLYVYQEQIMKATMQAGLSGVEAEEIRTTMKKKDLVKLNSFKERFVVGLSKKGCDVDVACSIWDKLLSFSGYGFNKCLAGDSLVKTKDGELSIEELCLRFESGNVETLYSLDDEGNVIEQDLKAVYRQGVQEVFEIELVDGNKLKLTANHRLLTKRGYVELKELYFTDEVVTLKESGISSSMILSIKCIGDLETFDIEMPEHHNFVVNNIVSHNSHSSSYTLLSYYGQWLKANYPLEFWTTAFNYGAEDKDFPYYLSEIKTLKGNIKISTPDINYADVTFQCDPETNEVFWSLNKIKGIGESVSSAIINDRKERGRFKNLVDFLSRVPKKNVNKNSGKALILSGAFDKMYDIESHKGRKDILLEFYKIRGINPDEDQDLMHKDSNKEYYWTLLQKKFIGIGDINFQRLVNSNNNIPNDIKEKYFDYDSFSQIEIKDKKSFYAKGSEVMICGFLTEIKIRNSKKGNFMILTISENDNNMNAVIWNTEMNILNEEGEIEDSKGKIIAITGRVSIDGYSGKNSLYSFTESKLYII